MNTWAPIVAMIAAVVVTNAVRAAESSGYSIVLASGARPAEKRGAEELAKYLKEISGGEFPIVSDEAAIAEKAMGPDHPDVGTDLNNLAGLLDAKGDYAGAEPLYRRALEICEKALGPDHPNTVIVRKNLKQLLEKEHAQEVKKND